MPISVGSVKITSSQAPQQRWAIGAAPRADPFWTLVDEMGQPSARLVIAFRDDEYLKEATAVWLDASHGALKGYVQRIVYELEFTDATTIGLVTTESDELRRWLSAVAAGSTDELPSEFAGADVDVLLLPSMEGGGRFAIVFNTAWDRRVLLTHPRALRWPSG